MNDKDFFRNNFYVIKQIFNTHDVKTAYLVFDILETFIYLEFKSEEKKSYCSIDKDLRELYRKNKTAYFVHLCGLELFGQKIDVPKESTNFYDLNPHKEMALISDEKKEVVKVADEGNEHIQKAATSLVK